jgi:hypothetical protein
MADRMREPWHDAGEAAYRAWETLSEAKTLPQQADAIRDLGDAMGDLVSFLPGWDWQRGLLVLEGDEDGETLSDP